MTVIGEAYIMIKGVSEGDSGVSKIEGQISGVGASAEKSSGRARAAFKSMGTALGSAFGPAFQPIQEVMDKFDELDIHGGKLKDNVGKYALGIGAAMTGAGTLLTTVSDKDKVSMGQLEQAVKNAGGDWEKYKDKTEEVVKSQEKYGHTAVETSGALNDLVTKTHNVHDSYENMQLVADVAAQKNTSLSSAASIVAKVMNGNTKTLKQYGITQDDINKKLDTGAIHTKNLQMAQALQGVEANKNALAALKTRDARLKEILATTQDKGQQELLRKEIAKDSDTRSKLTDAMGKNKDRASALKAELKQLTTGQKAGVAGTELLAEKMKGQAAIAADTFSGKMKEVRAKIEDFIGTVGQKLGPALQIAGPAMMGFGAIVESGIVGKIGNGIGKIKEFMSMEKLAGVATKVWTGIQAAFNIVMDANPIVLVGVAITALVGVLVLAYLKFKPFHDLINAIASDIKKFFIGAFDVVINAFHSFINAFETVWKFILDIVKKYWPIILAVILPFVGIPVLIMQNWNKIVSFFENLWGTVSQIFQNVVAWFGHLPSRIITALGNIGTKVWSAIQAGVQHFADKFIAVGKSLISYFGKFASRVISGIGNLGAKIWTNVSTGLGNLTNAFTNWIGRAVDWFGTLPNKVVNAIGNIGSAIWSSVTSGLNNFISHVTNWTSNIANYFGNLPSKIISAIGNLGSKIWNGVRGGLSTIKTNIVNAFSGAGSWLLSAGSDVVSGFIHGIENMFGSVVDTAKSLISHLGHSVLHALGIGSPSKVYHEIGKNVAAGLIQGLDHSHGDVGNAGRRLVNAVIHKDGGTIGVPMHANAAGAGGGRVINLFPNAIIDFGKESPASIVQRLQSAIVASRL
jgi:phage-related protein